jgi:uncharacterized protein YjeT (DUF2065 family)
MTVMAYVVIVFGLVALVFPQAILQFKSGFGRTLRAETAGPVFNSRFGSIAMRIFGAIVVAAGVALLLLMPGA